EVQNATFYVIRGDVNEAVCGEVMSLNDPSIDGWGLTEGTATEAYMPLLMMQDEGGNTDGAGGADGTDTQEDEVTDLKDYLGKPGGEFDFVLKSDGNEVAKDENKNYIVQPNVDYDLELIIKSLNGIHPGTYQYQMPAGLLLKTGANGTCTLQGTDVNVGTWTITENGLLTLEFFDNIKTYTEVEISATMGIRFLLQDEPIDFDGKITVTVEPPPEREDPTELLKWGEQGDPGKVGKPDNTKLYWQLVIKGHEDSQLPGSVITDRLMNGEQGVHQYTESDFEKGIRIGVSQPNPETGEELAWHQWTVYPGDPGLTWNENGWSYELPAKCAHCGSVSLGNDGWTYFVDFSSTPKPELIGGALYYYNQATVDGQNATGEATFNHGDVHAELIKNSAFHGDADGGSFLWELQAVIPGMKDGEKAEYFWYILDYMEVMTGNSVVDEVFNTANQATVTATVNGAAVKVPRVTDAAPEDQFAWDNSWSPMNPDETVEYGQQLDLLCRCRCTAENCKIWNQESGSCYSQHWAKNGFCHCWTETQDIIFTFSYETNDKTLIEQYGGVGNNLRNRAHLHKKDFSSDGHEIYTKVVDAEAREPIPGIFKKELIEEFNGYTAHYQITVNEAKLVLTDGTPLIINDEMTETLAYISGSLVITTEDADGNTKKLQQGTDYTVTYDGTGTVKDSSGNPVHVLKIEILGPQPVMYILDYDTTLIVPPGGAKDVKYSNSASITLWGETLSDSTDDIVDKNFNVAANSYQVDVLKIDSQTSEPLAGAVFGLFNAQGGQMTTGESDGNGRILFITDITAGVILRGHKLYYLQELKAPEGYQKDDSEHWFCFCNSNEESCAECDEVIGEKDAYRIPFDQIGEIAVANELKSYNLPATGGTGIYPLVFVSVILIVTSLIYGLYRRCKCERKGIG
ncbi:MAG: hypothetical protein IKU09_00190, partial [Firmicutes bacterium]|nr:hypothetical protein [Bacillota bacterium]